MALPSPQPSRRYTVAEYLRAERDSVEKHEYDDGNVIATPAASRQHVLIVGNVYAELRSRLRGGPCLPYASNLRIRVPKSRQPERFRYVYPDVVVIWGEALPDPNDDKGETFTNPRLVVEVLSPSTWKHARTHKFDSYREVTSFRECVLVERDMPRVETFFRTFEGTWELNVAAGLDAVVRLKSLGVELPLSEVYANVTFPPPAPEPMDDRRRPADEAGAP